MFYYYRSKQNPFFLARCRLCAIRNNPIAISYKGETFMKNSYFLLWN